MHDDTVSVGGITSTSIWGSRGRGNGVVVTRSRPILTKQMAIRSAGSITNLHSFGGARCQRLPKGAGANRTTGPPSFH